MTVQERVYAIEDLTQDLTQEKVRWLINAHWVAITTVVMVTLVAGWLQTNPQIWLTGSVAAFIAYLGNLLFAFVYRRIPERFLPRAIFAILVLDATVMTAGLHYSGGVMSPYVYLYILPILMGGVLLSSRAAWLLALLEGGQIALLTVIEQWGLWSPTSTLGGHHVGQSSPIQAAEAILAVWGMCGLTAFIYTYTANRLHRQEHHLLGANRALRARSRELEALNQVSDAIRDSLDPHEVMTRALQAALGVTGLDAGWFILGDGHEVWELPVAHGLTEQMLQAERDTPPTSDCICVRAFDTGQIQHASEMLACPRLAWDTIAGSGLRRHISVPLKAGDQVLGVLNLASSDHRREFSPEELRMLEMMGTQIGAALTNARLFQETQHRAEELERLYRVAVAASQSLDLETVLESALDEALSIPVLESRGGIFLLDEDKGMLRLTAHRGLPSDFVAGEQEVPLGECLCGLVALTKQSCITRGDDPRHTRVCPFSSWSHVSVPILSHNRLIGVLFVHVRPGCTVTAQEQRLLETLGQQIGLAVVNARLYAAEQERRRVAETLRQMAGLVSSSLALEEVLDLALLALRQIVPYATASIMLREDDAMVVTAVRGFEEPERVLGRRVSLQEGTLSADIVRYKEPILLDDVRQDPRWLPWEETAHVRAWLGVPLIVQDEVIGQLSLDGDRPGLFREKHLEALTIFAQQVANAIENARLYEEVRTKEKELAYQIDHASDPIFNLDAEGRFTLFNRAAEALSGYWREEILGRPYTDLFCPDYHDGVADLLAKTGGEGSRPYEVEILTKDGERVPVEIRLAPLYRDGQVIGAQVIARDIRERKQLEQMREDFIASVSHDLRTPLASITGFTEVLLSEAPGPLTEVQQEFLDIIAESGERLLKLVNQILDVSKLDSGRFELHPAPVDLRLMVKSLVDQIRPLATKKQIALEVEIASDLPVITADPDRMERVLANLLSNAVKFTPEGGSVRVRLMCNGEAIRCEVSDTGIGIPSEDLPHLFERFRRASNAQKRRVKGAGLGLYISKAIVEAHGGEIGVESRLGEGTTFWFTLPIGGDGENR